MSGADSFIIPTYEARPGSVDTLRRVAVIPLKSMPSPESREPLPRFAFDRNIGESLLAGETKGDAASVSTGSLQEFMPLAASQAFTEAVRTGPARCQTAVFTRAPRSFPIVNPTLPGGTGPSILPSMSLGRREFLSKHITSPVARVPRATREAAARSLGHLHPMVDKDIALHGPADYSPSAGVASTQVLSTKADEPRVVFDKARRPWFNDVNGPKPGPGDYEVAASTLSPAGVAPIPTEVRDMFKPPSKLIVVPPPDAYACPNMSPVRTFAKSPQYSIGASKRSDLVSPGALSVPGPGHYRIGHMQDELGTSYAGRKPGSPFPTTRRFLRKEWIGIM